MTTLPSRLNKIRPIVEKILQTGIDYLYLNIPFISRKGVEYKIPSGFLNNLENTKIIRCKDYGPITKLLPVLDQETEPDTCIITFDDDMIPDKQVGRILRRKAERYPNCCIGFSGSCAGVFPFLHQWIMTNGKDTPVDWLEGVHCILYRRKFLNKAEILRFSPELQYLLLPNDDHWMSAYLASRNVPRICIGYSANRYFTGTNIRRIDPLCGRHIELIYEHFRIMLFFISKGLYRNSYQWWNSVGATVLFSAIVIGALIKPPFSRWITIIIALTTALILLSENEKI